jgi:lysophospholipid acyltransferase (LPLAT)-like uncharacterized protein
VTPDIQKPYRPAALGRFTFGQRVLIRAADIAFFVLISAIGRTIRWETEGLEHLDAVTEQGKVPIYAFWHDRIFAGTYFFRGRGIVVLTSQSSDGEYIARFIQRFGYGAVRGSSSRGGVAGLVEMIRLMRAGLPAALTVDGPRGPRYEAKAGAALLAKKTGCPLVPFVVEPLRRVTLKSWDKMQIPLPFTRALVTVGEPIAVPADMDEGEASGLLQDALDRRVERGVRWRAAILKPAQRTIPGQ